MKRIAYLGLPAALLATSLFAACQNTARGVEQDAENNAAAAKEASREAAAETREAGREVKEAAGNAADATKEAASDVARETREATAETRENAREAAGSVGAAVDGAQQTLQIKTALIDADNIDAAGIDVDTDGAAKTVTLKGYVPTAAQKAAAERVAKEKAPSYRIVNNLVVRG
jgi:osmotically-inducible protein OsmY